MVCSVYGPICHPMVTFDTILLNCLWYKLLTLVKTSWCNSLTVWANILNAIWFTAEWHINLGGQLFKYLQMHQYNRMLSVWADMVELSNPSYQ